MTKYLFRDQECQILAHRIPGTFHGLVESKLAPMLVSGSYVGWMIQIGLTQQTGKPIKFICPIYLSAEGFNAQVEEWLQKYVCI